ncbi:SERPINE1 mRNA binding protein 1a isoform X2 [Corythoichthys intestinalis]|uniref:SERPINE1 mRNA binding protein 1a isoform X2 n=1 Tax=Corythoichthys intestinalis TaxID=161448 RepID=UPI0025A5F0F6|nr:plasminogen activator inhibitor 1 RNA-binding protein-like isoform X2 [Corythoichthys intestinalis]XP_061790554.1 SERPINE1 mRNA-binding protein 1-like [Nerophis lumbriciformis]
MPGQMQDGFGIAVTNRYDQLLDDESDPFELMKQAQAESKKKKEAAAPGAAKSAAQAAKQPKKESQKDRKTPLTDKKAEPQAPVPLKKDGPGMRRVGRKPEGEGPRPQGSQQGEGRPPADRRPVDRRPPRRFERPAGEPGDKPEGGEFSVEKPIGDRPMRGRGGGRGFRGGRGRGLGRSDGFDSRGKREFDRHSGSDRAGLKGEEKRGGSGSHNWGTVKDELNELDQSNVTEEPTEGEEHPPADSENKENEVEEVKEEGPKEMTLDEWKAMQDKERAKVEFNIRKANEGADWNKGFVLHKSKAEGKKDELIDSEAFESKMDDEPHFRKPANDITSQLEINFGDLGRPGRGRGGPRGGGGGRGGRGRGGPPPGERSGDTPRPARGGRAEKSFVSVPNVDDPEAFPALA